MIEYAIVIFVAVVALFKGAEKLTKNITHTEQIIISYAFAMAMSLLALYYNDKFAFVLSLGLWAAHWCFMISKIIVDRKWRSK